MHATDKIHIPAKAFTLVHWSTGGSYVSGTLMDLQSQERRRRMPAGKIWKKMFYEEGNVFSMVSRTCPLHLSEQRQMQTEALL